MFEHNGIKYYNDSKATIPQSTLAAIKEFGSDAAIYLFLGGISKGVDRTPFIQQLPTTVTRVFCFGGEKDELLNACTSANKSASAHATLEEAFAAATAQASAGTILLFSPSGASFDLFRNYQERGKRFEDLVRNYAKQQ